MACFLHQFRFCGFQKIKSGEPFAVLRVLHRLRKRRFIFLPPPSPHMNFTGEASSTLPAQRAWELVLLSQCSIPMSSMASMPKVQEVSVEEDHVRTPDRHEDWNEHRRYYLQRRCCRWRGPPGNDGSFHRQERPSCSKLAIISPSPQRVWSVTPNPSHAPLQPRWLCLNSDANNPDGERCCNADRQHPFGTPSLGSTRSLVLTMPAAMSTPLIRRVVPFPTSIALPVPARLTCTVSLKMVSKKT